MNSQDSSHHHCISLRSCAYLIVTYCFLVLPLSVSAQSVNMVSNPSFELADSSPDGLVDWEVDGGQRDSTVARTGNASLKLTGPTSFEYEGAPGVAVSPNVEYVFRAWIKSAPGNQGSAGMRFAMTIPQVEIWTSRRWLITDDVDDWQLVERRFTTPSILTAGRLDITWHLEAGDTVWIDDVSINPTGSYGPATQLILRARPTLMSADGQGFSVILAELADDAGNRVPTATQSVTFSHTGVGTLAGGPVVEPSNGTAAVFLRSPTTYGTAQVTASAPGLGSRQVSLATALPSAWTPEFAYGLFDDGNHLSIGPLTDDILARGMNAVMVTNSGVVQNNEKKILETTDSKGISAYVAPMHDLNDKWYDISVTEDLATALSVAQPIVDAFSIHPSLKAYYLYDEPKLNDPNLNKILLMNQAFQIADPNRPVFEVLNNQNGTPAMFAFLGADMMVTDPYVTATTPVGSWVRDWIKRLEYEWHTTPAGYPIMAVLQAHGDNDDDNPRYPTPEEVSAMHWIAIGQGARGIFWFIYGTQQWWTGLKDNPVLFNEITSLAQRTQAVRPELTNLVKGGELFSVSGDGVPYVSSLADENGDYRFVILCNGDCNNTRQLTLNSDLFKGLLEDVETGTPYEVGSSFTLAPGDGRIFRLEENLVKNHSFELDLDSNNYPDEWGWRSTAALDNTVARSGQSSLKVTGPAPFTYTLQNITLEPNTTYELSYWIKSSNVTTYWAVRARYAQLQPSTIVWWGPKATGTTDWTQYTKTFTTPNDYIGGRLDMCWELNAGGEAWIDDVYLTRQ